MSTITPLPVVRVERYGQDEQSAPIRRNDVVDLDHVRRERARQRKRDLIRKLKAIAATMRGDGDDAA